MNAMELTQNFNEASSAYSARDLYTKKRAKISPEKQNNIGREYESYLSSLLKVNEKDNLAVYKEILSKHNMVVYTAYITEAGATGAKKLRVGEVVEDASINFSKAIEVPKPQEEVSKPQVVEEIHEPEVVKEEVKPVVDEVPMSRTRRHEEEMNNETYHEPVVSPVPENISNQRLDNYLSSGISQAPISTEEQKFDILDDKLRKIAALNKQADEYEKQETELLAQEKIMDEQINAALKQADEDYLTATQSLDEVAKRINDTEERVRRKRELISRLGKVR